MQRSGLLKYQIGIGVLILLTAGLAVWLLIQGVAAKEDTQTYKAAARIAEDLNRYVESKDKIPSKLSDAGIDDVPDTVTYKKVSSSTYEFCATYKSASSGYSISGWDTLLFSTLYGTSFDNYDDYDSSYKESSLYISESHKKGENCQTVEPYIYSYDDGYGSSDDEQCAFDYNAEDYDKAIDEYYACIDTMERDSTAPDSNLRTRSL